MSKVIYLILKQSADDICCVYASFSKRKMYKMLERYRELFENDCTFYYENHIVVEKDYISKYEKEAKDEE